MNLIATAICPLDAFGILNQLQVYRYPYFQYGRKHIITEKVARSNNFGECVTDSRRFVGVSCAFTWTYNLFLTLIASI